MNLESVSSAATGRNTRAADTRRQPEDGTVTCRTACYVRRRQPRRRPRSPSRSADILRGELEAFASSVAVAYAAIATATSYQPAYLYIVAARGSMRSCRM